MHELITGARYLWNGSENAVVLDPAISPVQIFRVRHQMRSEHDFDYFL
jgi:starch synthase (maltosyl-transferring)